MKYRFLLNLTLCVAILFGAAACKTTSAEKPSGAQATAEGTAPDTETSPDADAATWTLNVDHEQIALDDEVLVSLEQYRVPSEFKKGGKGGLLIIPLSEALERELEDADEETSEGVLAIESSSEVPHRLLLEVIYSASDAGVDQFELRSEPGDSARSARFAGTAPKTAESDDPHANTLMIGIGLHGFHVVAGDEPVPPLEGCPDGGATVCVGVEPDAVREGIKNLRVARREKKPEFETSLMGAYDFRRLHNVVVALQKENPGMERLRVAMDPDMPVMLLARTLRVVQARLPDNEYDTADAFDADLAEADQTRGAFSSVTVSNPALVRMTGVGSVAVDNPKLINALGSLRGSSGQEGRIGARGSVIPGAVTVDGSIDERIVRRVVRKHRRELIWCYEQTRKKHPEAAGKVVFGVEVATDGTVESAKIASNDVDDTDFGACALSKVERWQFPESSGDESSSIQLPLTLQAPVGGLADKEGKEGTTPDGSLVVTGSLDKKIIQRVIKNHRNEIRFCYERQLQKTAGLEGRVFVKFTIAASGNVVSAVIKETSLDNREVESCMTRTIRRWVFPEPKGGGIVIVTYPFNFVASD